MKDDDIWFEPKRYGFGAGLPIAWQGWTLIVGYIAAILLLSATLLPRGNEVAYVVIVVALTLGLMAIAAQHTRGGWRWRWGDPD